MMDDVPPFTVVPPKPHKVLWGPDAARPQPMGTIVKGLIHAASLSLIYGPPKSGKSFWLTSLSLAIAGHQPEWMGHHITHPGPALYIACEGHAGFWKRLLAAGPVPDEFGLITCRPVLITLDKRNYAFPHPDEILATLDDIRQLGLEQPVLVCIDTVFRSFGSGNVNQSDHMNAYLAALSQIMDRGIAVALVHHEVKAGGSPAGSVALMAAADTIVATKNGNGNLHSWEVEMAKDDAQTRPRSFTLDVVEVGVDEFGEPITSCVMTDHGNDTATAPKRKAGRPKNDAKRQLGIDLLAEAILEHGEPPPAGTGLPASIGRVVHVHRWRDLVDQRTGAGDTPDAKRAAFRRLRDDLRDQNRIGINGIWVWICDAGQ
jgi:hypothetical protein